MVHLGHGADSMLGLLADYMELTISFLHVHMTSIQAPATDF